MLGGVTLCFGLCEPFQKGSFEILSFRFGSQQKVFIGIVVSGTILGSLLFLYPDYCFNNNKVSDKFQGQVICALSIAAWRRLGRPLSPIISGAPEGAQRPLCEGLTLRLLTREETHGPLELLGSLGRESGFRSWTECEPGGLGLWPAAWLTTGLPGPWKGRVYPGSLASRCQSSQLGPNHLPQLSMRVQSLLSLGDPLGLGLRPMHSQQWGRMTREPFSNVRTGEGPWLLGMLPGQGKGSPVITVSRP